MTHTSLVTTHVLDAATGAPAVGVRVELLDANGAQIASTRTDDDGRVSDLGPPDLEPGTYRLRFETGPWFGARGVETFYPEVTVTFTLDAGRDHLHVPILLSPFAYSTYRGS